MVPWILLCLALLGPLLPSRAAALQSPPDRVACLEEELDELGYSSVEVDRERGSVRAERRIGGPLAVLKQAGAFATGVATLGFVQPPVERRFDVLQVSLLGANEQRPFEVDAALMVVNPESSRRLWPRARTVIDALRLSAVCGAPPGQGRPSP